ncbi:MULTISPECIES: FUSC family protein [unclassified Amycolatopsis]|uniref:FUSC family protein n=1 Tax=unclassified Amycolatopsis TaxID=2618356 RepID=UPI002875CC05|nr:MULTISPECIES: FUSC family protein [unclassified Amycolatopsis]MDS0136723.1 FUSC family protein [Amycolatopsis sp. 505]MDS0143388.1 FUSC family protein [Amycolatopsis sp. CM201R]
MNQFRTAALDRLAAADPGLVRLRLAGSAVLGIVLAVLALLPAHVPLTVTLVGAIAAMMTAFTVNDPTPGGQAVTLVLAFLTGGASITVASLGSALPPLDSVVFVLLIFVAVYAQRFGPRGTALGSIAFFLFFFPMFLQAHVKQVPQLLMALGVGVLANALVRFVLLRHNAAAEFLRVRRAFRARLGAVVRAAEAYLAVNGSERTRKQLRSALARLHECVLLIEDAAPDVVDARAADVLRRRAIEVELAVGWLAITVQRTCSDELTAEVRDDLIARLARFRALMERDPRELPLISQTGEYSRMLVEGSRIDSHAAPGDGVRKALAELALADDRAQRAAGPEAIPDPLAPDDTDEPAPKFAYDNRTRSAIQAVVGGGLAVLGGELVSHQRWYWAVLTVFVVFIGASSAGATFVKGVRRLGGTLIGIVGGVLLALLVGGNTAATLALILVCVFGMVYTARVSQVVMAFFVTSMLGLLYSLLGTFSLEVLWIRVAETAVGAAAGILAAVVIVPVRTRSVMLDDVAAVLDDLEEFLEHTRGLLAGEENVNIIELSRDLDRSVDQVRTTIEPLTHPVNLRSARRDYGWHVLTTLETIAFRARHVAARAQPGQLTGADADRLRQFTGRLLANIDVLRTALNAPGGPTPGTLVRDDGTPVSDRVEAAETRAVLSSLSHLDEALVSLGRVFGVEATDPRAPLRR